MLAGSRVSTSSAQLRFETLRRQFDLQQQRSSDQTTLGLVALLTAGLAISGTVLIFSYAATAGVPFGPRVLLFGVSAVSLLFGLVFAVRSLLNAGRGAGETLLLHPGLAGLPGNEALLETTALQYGAAAGDYARRNESRRLDLIVTGWTVVAGVILALILFGWSLMRVPPTTRGWLQLSTNDARDTRPATGPDRISQDHSDIAPLPADSVKRSGPRPAEIDGPRPAEIDGACCLFEDRRVTR